MDGRREANLQSSYPICCLVIVAKAYNRLLESGFCGILRKYPYDHGLYGGIMHKGVRPKWHVFCYKRGKYLVC
jgi:hypothetical protein